MSIRSRMSACRRRADTRCRSRRPPRPWRQWATEPPRIGSRTPPAINRSTGPFCLVVSPISGLLCAWDRDRRGAVPGRFFLPTFGFQPNGRNSTECERDVKVLGEIFVKKFQTGLGRVSSSRPSGRTVSCHPAYPPEDHRASSGGSATALPGKKSKSVSRGEELTHRGDLKWGLDMVSNSSRRRPLGEIPLTENPLAETLLTKRSLFATFFLVER